MPRPLNWPAGIIWWVGCYDEMVQWSHIPQSPQLAQDLGGCRGPSWLGPFPWGPLWAKGLSRSLCKITSSPALPRLSAAWQSMGKHCPALLVSAMQAWSRGTESRWNSYGDKETASICWRRGGISVYTRHFQIWGHVVSAVKSPCYKVTAESWQHRIQRGWGSCPRYGCWVTILQ